MTSCKSLNARMAIVCISTLTSTIPTAFAASTAFAQDEKAPSGGEDLTTRATNPAAALIQLQLQNVFIPETDDVDGYANTAILQPVYPIVLDENNYFQSIITRTTIPLVTTPKLPTDEGRETGLGDTVILAAPTHKASIGNKGEFFQWGPVAAATIPTATKDETGSGRMSLGPGILGLRNYVDLFTEGDGLLLGTLAYQQWSIDEDADRDPVSELFFQPVALYRFESLFDQKGWYGGTPDDLWRYDWNDSHFESIPLGARLGRVTSIGKQPINFFAQSWCNAAGDSGRSGQSEYTFKLNLTLLFPE